MSAQEVARSTWPRLALRLVGAGLLVAAGSMHLDLYLTGFKNIPTIGVLFLLQVIAAFGLALIVAVTGSKLFAAAGALFALATLGGYLLAIWVGLFGFTEARTTAGIVTGVIEVAAFAVLSAYCLAPGPGDDRVSGVSGLFNRLVNGVRQLPGGGAASAGIVSVAALVLLILAVATAGNSSAAAPGALRTESVNGVPVLTNSKGITLYWFQLDKPNVSKCYGSCASYWSPVKGPVTASPGIPGKLATIKRTDGTLQATYNGRPLYTYVGDGGPGQAKGNNLNINGGLWYDIPIR